MGLLGLIEGMRQIDSHTFKSAFGKNKSFLSTPVYIFVYKENHKNCFKKEKLIE